MLVKIGAGRSGEDAPRGVVPRLEDCHGRIRRFTAVATKLAVVADATDDDIRQAAAGCVSYFGTALPQHSADEDDSIAPHIAADPAVAGALADMTAQHRRIHAVVDQLLPLWRRVEAAPGELAGHQPDLTRLAAELERHFDAHLRLEETTIFPVIAALPADVQDAIIREMVARRLP